VPGWTMAEASLTAPMYWSASLARAASRTPCGSVSMRHSLAKVREQVMQPVPDQAGGIDADNIDEHRAHELFEQLLRFIRIRLDQSREIPRREISSEQAQHAEGKPLRFVPAVVAEAE
jgi:hypothetical protein